MSRVVPRPSVTASPGALWADPEVVSLHRLPMRPPSEAYPSIADLRAGAPNRWRRPLDGTWLLMLFESPDVVPDAAISGRADAPGWQKVRVPGNWTMQGVGDLPHYTNIQMPFDGPPPRLPERNPTGVYRRTLRVPARWLGRQIVLHIGGGDSVHAVYVNGTFVGYGTDSRLASEYDVSAAVHAGDNDVAIVVVRYSAHSYVEDQDQWWMAGLHREVYAEARAPVHIAALVCDADLDEGIGRLVVRATVGGTRPPGRGWTVRVSLETSRGRRVVRSRSGEVPHRFNAAYLFTGHTAVVGVDVAGVEPWSAERPTRYRVVAELVDPDGVVTEVHGQFVGFRRVEVRDRQLLVNGEPVWIFGVNRHDHHPVRGKAVTVADMRDDLLAMRRHNITAVRTAHYPNDPRFLDLCDEIGMYVIDEANIESHAYNTSLCNDARYRSAWLARGARMVERDRNHPSVIMWSLGNESGHGDNHRALAAWIRHTDPTRPLHYEGAVFHDGWIDGGRDTTDVVCPMYPPIDAIEAYGRDERGDRPLILCEYSHAMGNSNGSLADYWDVITTTPGLQGGFVWEWKDHGLLTRLPNGRRGFAYGGQFGEVPNDANFVADGLMASDLVPRPVMQELTWVYRPVTVTLAGDALSITNRRSFTDLADLRAEWELLVDAEVRSSGTLDVPGVAPGASVSVPLPTTVPTDGAEAVFTVRWVQRTATPWAPRGHLVAWDQSVLTEPSSPEMWNESRAGRPICSTFRVDDLEIAACVFRPPVDNDGFKLMRDRPRVVGSDALERWLAAGLDRLPANSLVEHHHEVEADVDGSVIHRHVIVVPDALADLPRVGATFEVPDRFDHLVWYGRGPLENVPDRNRGAILGRWEAPVDDPPYLVPQDFGLRTDCRWFEFTDRRARAAIRLDVLEPRSLHVGVTRFRDQDLFNAAHETDLRVRRNLTVHVDIAHRGVGTASCGPDVADRYRIVPGTYRFAYRLSMVNSGARRRRT